MKAVSVIIVAFHAKDKLKRCLASIPKNKNIEVIVVDNSVNNRGFGKACNVGAKKAKNELLFFLNPDTQVFPDTISLLADKLHKDEDVGIISPQFLNDKKQPYLSYTTQPTALTSLFRFSFIQVLLPRFLQKLSDPLQFDSPTQEKFVEGVSGAAIMISKKLFNDIDGFDERFFMYWEDFDICKKVLIKDKKILFYPAAKIIHSLGGTTKDSKVAQKYFVESRYLYFKKYFGSVNAYCIEGFLRSAEKLSLD